MENFGYLEMAIAQETCAQAQHPSTLKKGQPSPSTQQVAKRHHGQKPVVSERQDLDNTQVVGWWGLF